MLGDSLSDTGKGLGAPPKFVQLLQVWLKQAFGKRFKNQGNILPHAVQDDRYSCAIVTANTIAHAVLDQPLWRPAAAITERLTWFMRMASSQAISGVPSSQATNPPPEKEVEEDCTRKPQNRSALTITDLLNPIQPTSPIQSRDYDSDSESSQSELNFTIDDDRSFTYDHATNTIQDSEPSTPLENESAMQVDDKAPTNLPQKRPQHSDSSNSDNDSSDNSSDSSDARPLKYVKSGDGTSKSAVASRSLRKSVKSGTFNINQEKYQNWKTKILQSDRDAEFDEHDLWKVRHSVCGEWKRVKEPYDATRWKKHLKDCEDMKKKKIFKTPSLFSMGFIKVAKQAGTRAMVIEPPHVVPCPGITEADDARVTKYLKRTGVLGGGGRSLAVISKERFKKLFSKLEFAKSKKTVVDIQMHEWKWRNDHENLRVYSTSCQKDVPDRSTNAKRPKPCSSCITVLRSRPFKTAIRIPIPSDENYKFVNSRFRNKLLGNIFGRTIGVKNIIEDRDNV
jgi:hypothetical protein